VLETLIVHDKPAAGLYEEIYTLEIARFYSDHDGATTTTVCKGTPTTFEFRTNLCTNNAILAAGVLHMLHLTIAQEVRVFLASRFNVVSSSNAISSNDSTITLSPTAVSFNGNASVVLASVSIAGIGVFAAIIVQKEGLLGNL